MAVRMAIVVRLILLISASIVPTSRATGTSYRSREASILTEIDQLHSSFQAYKEKYGVYPPCICDADPEVRKVRFMAHLRTVYPSSAYGVRSTDFDTLATYVAANYKVATRKGAVSLDLNRLDPAEAIVFWLGGFPTPVVVDGAGQVLPIAPGRLFGFNRDGDGPFNRSLSQEGADPLSSRTGSRFDLREERLVDNDGDGWWEYLPTYAATGELVAPYVYFDSATYVRSSTADERGTVIYPKEPGLVTALGTVVPFVERYDPADPASLKWRHPESSQIICGGFDGVYSAPTTGARVELFPGGLAHRGPTFAGPPIECDEEELDNFTNLARTMLSGNTPGACPRWGLDWNLFHPELYVILAILLITAFVLRRRTRPKSAPISLSGPVAGHDGATTKDLYSR